eukprot:m.74518 g.74518  ORF g.74518 m.74518 type:complete len:290 (+) comp14510_c0_seq1:72-941(+)
MEGSGSSPLIDSADYELHQQTKAVARRHFSKGNAEQAVNAIAECMRTLLGHNAVESAVDLSKMVIDYFKRSTQTAATLPTAKNQALRVYAAFGRSSERRAYLAAITTWAEGVAAKANSDLHLKAAEGAEEDKDFAAAVQSYMKMTEEIPFDKFSMAIVQQQQADSSISPADAAIAPVTKLAEISPPAAEALLRFYVTDHPSLREPLPYSTPTLVFLRQLCLTLSRSAKPLYDTLIERYKPLLNKNQRLSEAVKQLGRIHYNIQPPAQQSSMQNNLFGNLLQMMGGGART